MTDWRLGHKRTTTEASRAKVAAWYNTADPLDRYHGSVALLAIADGTWSDKYLVWQDFERPNRFQVFVNERVIITVRLYQEYPSYFTVDRIGDA